jgi:hypothetical protein
LFDWQGDLYRGIYPDKTPFYQRLLGDGVIERLVQKGLFIETEPADLEVEGFDLVFRHRRLPFVSYPFEWTASMLRDAATLQLRLWGELNELGLGIQDIHPWNLLFDGPRPVFVDLGSLMPKESQPSTDFFRLFFLNPLRLISMGENRIARWSLRDATGMTDAEIDRLAAPTFGRAARYLRRSWTEAVKSQVRSSRLLHSGARMAKRALGPTSAGASAGGGRSLARELKELEHQVAAIDLQSSQEGWIDYYPGWHLDSLHNQSRDNWTVKQTQVHQVLSELAPATVVDLGSNRGLYSQMAAQLGAKVVAIDNDSITIDALYLDARPADSAIVPLEIDVLNPTPSLWWMGDQFVGPASERLGGDLVIALGLVHHLVFQSLHNADFSKVTRLFAAFSKRWLLVEFVPKTDHAIQDWGKTDVPWYELESFICALEAEFRVLRRLPSTPEDRVLLLCERRPTDRNGSE